MSWKLKKIFYDFQKSTGLPEGQKYLYWSLTSPRMSWKLQNIFVWFLKALWIARRSKKLSWSLTSPAMSWKLQNNFLWFLKVSWIARRSEISFLKFDKSWNVLEASKYFSMIFKSLLDYQKVRNIFPEVWQVLECLESFKIFFYDF